MDRSLTLWSINQTQKDCSNDTLVGDLSEFNGKNKMFLSGS